MHKLYSSESSELARIWRELLKERLEVLVVVENLMKDDNYQFRIEEKGDLIVLIYGRVNSKGIKLIKIQVVEREKSPIVLIGDYYMETDKKRYYTLESAIESLGWWLDGRWMV